MIKRGLSLFVSTLSGIALAACASGSAIVTGKVRMSISPEQVRLYLEPPAEFEVIALVSASSDAGWTEQGSLDYAIEELKSQAAKVGANSVLIGSTGESTSAIVGGYGAGYTYAIPVTAKIVQGHAIYVRGRERGR